MNRLLVVTIHSYKKWLMFQNGIALQNISNLHCRYVNTIHMYKNVVANFEKRTNQNAELFWKISVIFQ